MASGVPPAPPLLGVGVGTPGISASNPANWNAAPTAAAGGRGWGDERTAVRGEADARTGVAERAAIRLHELRVPTVLASVRGIGVAAIGGGRPSPGRKCDQCCPSRYP